MNNIYYVFLHSCGFSQKELGEIFEEEKNAENFYKNLSSRSIKKYVRGKQREEKILEEYKNINEKKILDTLSALQVTIITHLDDKEYPEALRYIPHSPFILYVRGKIPKGDMFGVVGSRKISQYGIKVIEKLVPDISEIFPIVSGGAAGCDTLAHKTCLQSENPTVVVVGTGIDQTYPVSNEKLFDKIVESGGAIISIFRIGEPGNPYNFPVRNEIVVGLCRGILVVEAQEKSGSLITAGLCLDLGKDLFSIPGDILSPFYAGTNKLIKKGEAKSVTNVLDILEEYNREVKKHSHTQKHVITDESEQEIYKLLSLGAYNIDEISQRLSISTSELLGKISLLEIKGIIKKDLSGKYELA